MPSTALSRRPRLEYSSPSRELLGELGFDLAVLPDPLVLRLVQDQETERPGESVPFRRRHLVFIAHLAVAVALVEQDDPGQAPVVWLPAADAAGLHLYPDVGAVLGQALRPDAAAGGPHRGEADRAADRAPGRVPPARRDRCRMTHPAPRRPGPPRTGRRPFKGQERHCTMTDTTAPTSAATAGGGSTTLVACFPWLA